MARACCWDEESTLTRNTRYASFLVTEPQQGSVSLYFTAPALQEWFPLQRRNTNKQSSVFNPNCVKMSEFTYYERYNQMNRLKEKLKLEEYLLKVITNPVTVA